MSTPPDGIPDESDNRPIHGSKATEPELPERGGTPSIEGDAASSELDEQAGSDVDQSHADTDQTAADVDQTASDADQAASYSDQRRADLEQSASDSDQATADRESRIGPGSEISRLAYDAARAVRAGTSAARLATAANRAATTVDRTRQGERRDQTALLRDLTASARDLAAETHDRAAALQAQALLAAEGMQDPGIRALLTTSEDIRLRAAADRARAAGDRERAAADRAQAAVDRRQARIELQSAHFDALTGVYVRDFGRLALQHAIDRSRRSGEPFVLAFVDVDGLKELNDREGHAAGDALLQAVGSTLRARLRPYDPVVRVGGDEFLCGLTNTDLAASKPRFEEIRAAIERGPVGGSITVGFALLGTEDTLEALIATADLDMYARKPNGPYEPSSAAFR